MERHAAPLSFKPYRVSDMTTSNKMGFVHEIHFHIKDHKTRIFFDMLGSGAPSSKISNAYMTWCISFSIALHQESVPVS
jgi:hypothetical protein